MLLERATVLWNEVVSCANITLRLTHQVELHIGVGVISCVDKVIDSQMTSRVTVRHHLTARTAAVGVLCRW